MRGREGQCPTPGEVALDALPSHQFERHSEILKPESDRGTQD